MSYPIPAYPPPSDEDFQPVGDSLKRVMEALGLPLALGHKSAAGAGDFLANTTANLFGMKRRNPSAMSDTVTSPDTSFRALGEIGDAFNPKPMLRSAFGWEDADEAPISAPSKRSIGVGGPSPQVSIPRLGARSPVVVDNDSGSVMETGEIPPAQGFGDEPALPASAFAQPQQGGQVSDPYDLGAQYRQRVSGIQKPSGELTPEQQQQLNTKFYMNLLAGNKPGSRFLQNAGRAGMETSDQATAFGDRNYARSAHEGDAARREAGVEVELTQRGQDNREQARHQKKMEDLQQKQLDITQQYNEGRIDAKAAELEVRKIQAQMAELRALAARDRANPLEQQIQTIMKYGPKGMGSPEALSLALSKGKSDEDTQIDEAWKAATSHALSNGMPAPSRDQVVAVRKYGGSISRNHADYKEALRSLPGGDTKQNRERLDGVLKTRGLRVVD